MQEHLSSYIESPSGSSDRWFGLVFAGFFTIVGVLPILHGRPLHIWALALAGAFLTIALALPALLSPLNKLWTKFGLLLHSFMSPIALGILFFAVVTPTGLLMRLLGKDPLRLRMDKAATSYWIARKPPGPTAESLKNQF